MNPLLDSRASVVRDREPAFRRYPPHLRSPIDLAHQRDNQRSDLYMPFGRGETSSFANRNQRATGGQQFRVGNIGQNGTLYLR